MPGSMRQARDIRRAAIELDAEPPRKRVGPGEVVVSRTDLEWALRLIENVHTVTWPNAKDVPYVEFDRLRAVLNTENQT